MAYWRRQFEENYEAAACARLDAYAITARHAFITKRMENMAHALKELSQLGGIQEVEALLREEQTSHVSAPEHRDAGHTASADHPAVADAETLAHGTASLVSHESRPTLSGGGSTPLPRGLDGARG